MDRSDPALAAFPAVAPATDAGAANALMRAALAVSRASGPDSFDALASEMSAILGADAAFIAVFKDNDPSRMRTLACCLDGRLLRPFEYSLQGTPCEDVTGRDFRCMRDGAGRRFPPGSLFAAKGMDGYAGYPLTGSAGQPLGLIVAMTRRPLESPELFESMLKIFAARVSGEIERVAAEDLMRRAALAVSSVAGDGVFAELIRVLCELLAVDVGFISIIEPGRPHLLKTVAVYADGRVRENVEYEIAGTPCAEVLDRQYWSIADGVCEHFPLDADLAQLGVRGYAGHALSEGPDGTRGIMSVAARRPLPNTDLFEAVIKIFAVRSAAELDRGRAQAALLDSEASYRAIFETSEDAIFVHDWDTGRILDVSPAATKLYGWLPEELRHLSVAAVSENAPPYTEREALAYIQQARVRETPVRFEWHARHKDGELLWNDVTLKRATIAGEPRILAFVRDVTARKAAEERLRASEEQHRTIFNASVDGIVLKDADHRVVDVNEAFLRMLGYRREELVGRPLLDFLAPELHAACTAWMPRILAGESCRIEAETRRHDGSLFNVEIHGVPMQYRGQPHALVILRDITEGKRAEKQLRDSEERYRLLFETESDAILLVDVETLRLVDANPSAERLWGYDRDELLALAVSDLSAEPEHTRASIQRPTGRVEIPLRWHRRKDGTRFPVEITANRLMLDGRLTVVAAVRDITDRIRAEEALRASEEQYRAIFNASADALVLRDAQFRIVDVNATYERMSGYGRAEVLGVDRVLANPPAMAPGLRALHNRALAGEPVQLETQLMRRDGLCRDLELRGVPVRHRGEPHVLWVGRDITDRKRGESERARLEAQLRQAQKMEAIGQLTGGIAHDFNNILTSVVGYVVLAAERESAAADSKLSHYLHQAEQSCRRARDLIQQMLTFSRGQRGERRRVSLPSLVREGAQLVRPMLPASLELNVDALGAAMVEADPVQLEQVLLNLCINARDATGGSGEIRLTVREWRGDACTCASCRAPVSGRYVEMAVADDGPGIGQDMLERVFEPFFSTKEVGKGTGMGLAVVHGIVHEHGGHICVDSSPDSGTVFRVLLPIAEGGAAHGAAEGRSGRAPRPPAMQGRVLLVDDEHAVLAFMRELLETWGLGVTPCTSGTEALEALEYGGDDVALVITDQTMPRMTGLQLATEIARRRPELPVVLYTGYAEGLPEGGLEQAGVRAVVRKPIEPAELRNAIVPLLGRP